MVPLVVMLLLGDFLQVLANGSKFIHDFWDCTKYHSLVLKAFFQSTGWPSVVSIMSHWFGKQRYQLFIFSWRLWALY